MGANTRNRKTQNNQGFRRTGNNKYSVDDVQVVAKRPARKKMTIGVDHRELKPEPRINSVLRAIKKFLLGTPS